MVGKMGCPASEGHDHCWREALGSPSPFTFRSRCSNSSRLQGRRPRKTKDSPKEVLPPDLRSEWSLLHLCWDPQVEQSLSPDPSGQRERPTCGPGDREATDVKAPFLGGGDIREREKGAADTLRRGQGAQRGRSCWEGDRKLIGNRPGDLCWTICQGLGSVQGVVEEQDQPGSNPSSTLNQRWSPGKLLVRRHRETGRGAETERRSKAPHVLRKW